MTSFPLYTTAKTLSRMGGAVLGGKAVEQFEGVNSLVLDAADLFYPKNITLYGIKTFSNTPIDHAILDATSVLCRTKSVLGCVFLKIIGNHTDYLSPVDSISYEDGMGISAWVNDRRILIGSRELMVHHGIDVPSKDYEDRYLEQNRNLVYLSASGELSGVFILGLGYSEDIRNMLIDLYNNNVLAVVRTVDPILTQEQLAKIFDLPLETFAVVPSRLSKELDASLEPAETAPALVCHNGRAGQPDLFGALRQGAGPSHPRRALAVPHQRRTGGSPVCTVYPAGWGGTDQQPVLMRLRADQRPALPGSAVCGKVEVTWCITVFATPLWGGCCWPRRKRV